MRGEVGVTMDSDEYEHSGYDDGRSVDRDPAKGDLQ
jgi:hypothetical protein